MDSIYTSKLEDNASKKCWILYGGLTGKTGDDFNVEDDNESYMLSFHLQISLITLSLTRISFIR